MANVPNFMIFSETLSKEETLETKYARDIFTFENVVFASSETHTIRIVPCFAPS